MRPGIFYGISVLKSIENNMKSYKTVNIVTAINVTCFIRIYYVITRHGKYIRYWHKLA